MSIIFTSRKVLLPGYETPHTAAIVVDKASGKIVDVKKGPVTRQDFPQASTNDWIDAGDKWILPGLVDAHVHLNEPGRTGWEGFYTGTLAAASGGVTTVVDMPLNSIPPTTTVDNLDTKRKTAKGQCWVDAAFWGGLIPGNEHELKTMADAGVKGFKSFLIESGVDEFPCVKSENVEKAMQNLRSERVPLLFHAELESNHTLVESKSGSDPTHYSTFLDSRPQKFETDAIEHVLNLQAKYPTQRCHIVHLSAASALPSIRAAKASGLPLTVETCFHYLVLDASAIPDGAPQYKCCPPIRDAANRDALWDALKDGTIDVVVSDHSPCIPELKHLQDGDIMKAWGGISTLGLGLSLLWTEGRKRGVGIADILRWCSERTAKLASVSDSKGAIKAGLDADLIIWDPEAETKIDKSSLHFKNKLSPYEGHTLFGKVEKTFVRGELVWDAGSGVEGREPIGQLL